MRIKYIFLGFIIGFSFTFIVWIFNEKIPVNIKSKIADNRLKLSCKLDQLINYSNDTKGSCVNGKFIYLSCPTGYLKNNICSNSNYKKNFHNQKYIPSYEEEFFSKLIIPNRSIYKTSILKKNEINEILGTNNLKYESTKCNDYNNNINECFLYFENLPPVKFFESKNKEKDIAILLHGHGSNSIMTLGITGEIDYMRSIGKYLLEKNIKVISVELTDTFTMGKKINDSLLFHGTTIYGLHAKSICTIANNFKNNNVYVYGLSNGGLTALFASNICDANNIKFFFIDDIFQNWFNSWTSAIKKYEVITQTYGYTFQKNFYYRYSDAALLLNSNYKLYLTRNYLSDIDDLKTCITNNIAENIFFIEKKIKDHVAEKELFLETILDKKNNLNSISKQCILNNVRKLNLNN